MEVSYSWEILSFKTLTIQCYVEHVETRKIKFHLASIEGSTTKERDNLNKASIGHDCSLKGEFYGAMY